MILRNFILADAVTFGPDRKLFLHGGGIGKIFATRFPWPQPQLAVLVSLEPEDEEPGTDHNFEVTFLAPTGDDLEARLGGNFRIPPSEHEEFRTGIQFASQFVGVAFPQPGLYWVRALYDGNELGRIPLEVIEREESGWVPLGETPPAG